MAGLRLRRRGRHPDAVPQEIARREASRAGGASRFPQPHRGLVESPRRKELRPDRRRAHLSVLVAPRLHRCRERRRAAARRRLAAALQGPAAVSPADELDGHGLRPAAPGRSRGGRRPARARPLDADADGDRDARALRLVGLRRQARAPRLDTGPAAGVPLEPRVGDSASAGRAGAGGTRSKLRVLLPARLAPELYPSGGR